MVEVLARGSALKHIQIREYVRDLAVASAPGTPTPSERELVNKFRVARMTVRQAMDALVVDGLIERIPGRGTFVAGPRRQPSRVCGFTEEMRGRGLVPSSRTLLAQGEVAGPGVARALEVAEGEQVVHWRRLRLADDVPVCVEDAFLVDRMVPGLLDDPQPESLYAELAFRNLRPTWAEDTVAAAPVGDDASILELAPGAAVLQHSRRTLAGDAVVEVSRSSYRSDRYTMRLEYGVRT